MWISVNHVRVFKDVFCISIFPKMDWEEQALAIFFCTLLIYISKKPLTQRWGREGLKFMCVTHFLFSFIVILPTLLNVLPGLYFQIGVSLSVNRWVNFKVTWEITGCSSQISEISFLCFFKASSVTFNPVNSAFLASALWREELVWRTVFWGMLYSLFPTRDNDSVWKVC